MRTGRHRPARTLTNRIHPPFPAIEPANERAFEQRRSVTGLSGLYDAIRISTTTEPDRARPGRCGGDELEREYTSVIVYNQGFLQNFSIGAAGEVQRCAGSEE